MATSDQPPSHPNHDESLYSIDEENHTKCASILSDSAISAHPVVCSVLYHRLYHKYQVQIRGVP